MKSGSSHFHLHARPVAHCVSSSWTNSLLAVQRLRLLFFFLFSGSIISLLPVHHHLQIRSTVTYSTSTTQPPLPIGPSERAAAPPLLQLRTPSQQDHFPSSLLLSLLLSTFFFFFTSHFFYFRSFCVSGCVLFEGWPSPCWSDHQSIASSTSSNYPVVALSVLFPSPTTTLRRIVVVDKVRFPFWYLNGIGRWRLV